MFGVTDFAPSTRSTIGLEWELQLIDRDSNELRQCANAILELASPDGIKPPSLHREMLLNTLEFTSFPRTTVQAAVADLRSAISLVQPITDKLRINLASAGSHPFANPTYQRVTDSERYERLVNRTQYWGRQMLLYGTHVHVGIENVNKVWPIVSALLSRAGQLQALAASSPFWAGDDTRYASNRAMVFQQLPTAGVPFQLNDWEEYKSYSTDMLQTGIIENANEIRWDIRPSPQLGTVEVRICDAASNLKELGAHAALIHCLVEHYSSQLDAGQSLRKLPDWFVRENKWRSARYGMEAKLIVEADGREQAVGKTLLEMVEVLQPVARRLECEAELQTVAELVESQVGYQRQRAVAARWGGSLDAVVEYLVAEFDAGRPLEPIVPEGQLNPVSSSRRDRRSH